DQRRPRTFGLADHRRRKDRTHFIVLDYLQRLFVQLGSEVDQVAFIDALNFVGGRGGRERLSRRIPRTRNVALLHRTLLDGPYRFAALPVEYIQERLFAGLRHDWDLFALDLYIRQDRGRRVVMVPDAVMDVLIMPAALASLEIQRHEAFAEQVIPG